MRWQDQQGFTLSELLSAIAVSAVVILAFGSTLMFTRNEFHAASRRVTLAQDAVVVDRYVRNKLTSGISDSLAIYADLAAEQAEETSTSGIILRLVDSDTVAHRVLISSDRLLWTENDSIVHYPIDNNVQNLLFEERDGNMGKILNMTVEVMSDVDTLEYAWEITLRN